MSAARKAIKAVLEQAVDNRYVGEIVHRSERGFYSEFTSPLIQRLRHDGAPVRMLLVKAVYNQSKLDRRVGLPFGAVVRLMDVITGNTFDCKLNTSVAPFQKYRHEDLHNLLPCTQDSVLFLSDGAPGNASFALLGPRPFLEKLVRQHAAGSFG